MTCRTCRYCAPVTDETGYCHRGPPTLVPPEPPPLAPPLLPKHFPSSSWAPVSLAQGWCGEYRWRWWRFGVRWFFA